MNNQIKDIVKMMKEFVERQDKAGISDCREMYTDTLLDAMNRIKHSCETQEEILQYYRDEIERYKSAVKPLLEYDFGDYITPWKVLLVGKERIEGAVVTANGFPFSLAANRGCEFGYDDYIKMANLIGGLQQELKPKKEEVDEG